MTPLSWVVLGVSLGILLTSGVAWYQSNLLRQEADRLRQTLNSWQDEAQVRDQMLEKQTAICEQLVTLTNELIPSDDAIDDPEESLRHLHRVISKQGRANRDFRARMGQVSDKLDELKKVLQTTEDARAQAEARARRAEESLATTRNGTGDQDLRAHIAMISAERDALKARVRDLTAALRRTS